ncbi:MAG: ATP-dependent DNA helicase RecG [Betaproteobacteria bacterium]|nr:ATP-dependent DNA helicase RecG [Betaproteobacteria bacterium]
MPRPARKKNAATSASTAASGASGIAQKLAKIGLRADWDFALHLPIRYEDETRITRVRDARLGEPCQLEAEITHNEIAYRPRRQLVVQARDGEDVVYLRFLNFYGSQVKQLAVGRRLRLFGEVRQGFFGAEMVHPRYHLVSEGDPVPEALTPVYSTTAGVGQFALRRKIDLALGNLRSQLEDDALPGQIRDRLKLDAFSGSVLTLHRPPPNVPLASLAERTHPAWRRIKFDELLAQQLAMKKARAARDAKSAPRLTTKNKLTEALKKSLPFGLTGAQQRAWQEIAADLAAPHPMQRLLQGDVGSGKTVVSALAATQAIDNGYQAAIMAPTEILAEQHFRKLSALLAPLGVNVTWLTGSLKAKEKREAIEAIASGETQLAIGTHALFQEGVTFAKLGLAVIDEQHRFGVGQRLALREKGEKTAGRDGGSTHEPHQLMMSATPIPRTLSMSYFADLDVSVIDELPPGRTPIVTKLLADSRRDEVLARIRAACQEGAQAYWVCPLIEESETLQLKTAVETFETLTAALPDVKVGLVHGRMKPSEKNEVMSRFVGNEIQLLVATTVIEVGVDVPNATLMVIEHAERMGLSQMHQLRGRVGRGAKQSTCVLLYQSPLGEMARARLKVIYESTDGFEIAREDLRLRGPGEHLGARQSGAPLLRFADIERDIDLLEAARDAAAWMLKHEVGLAEKHLTRWLGSRQHYLKA